MTDELIPADLRDFILKYIDSVAHLEALLLLRANPHVSWDVPTTAKRLYITEQQAGEVLDRLREDGLLQGESGLYRYQGESTELKAMADRHGGPAGGRPCKAPDPDHEHDPWQAAPHPRVRRRVQIQKGPLEWPPSSICCAR
jgi:hypothetical protein